LNWHESDTSTTNHSPIFRSKSKWPIMPKPEFWYGWWGIVEDGFHWKDMWLNESNGRKGSMGNRDFMDE
jgi:hypothetical protein